MWIDIYYVSKPEQLKGEDGPKERWKLIAELTDNERKVPKLEWLYTYNAKLATIGYKEVELFRDRQYNLCIRIPRREHGRTE